MPVLPDDMARRPSWCELEHFEIVSLPTAGSFSWNAEHEANKLVVVEGIGALTIGAETQTVTRGATVDLATGVYTISAEESSTFVTLGGTWGRECGGAGLFSVVQVDSPGDSGDPVSYPKHTAFDRHYHDCDEYWIVVSGSGTAVSEDVTYTVGPGSCVVTQMGHHHDFPLVDAPVVAVFFETTMRGRKRRGHLWEHTHGPAEPAGRKGE
ncbi:cupin domain-containing protein [Actinopolymorpha pittospori]